MGSRQMPEMLGVGLYAPPEAARLSGLSAPRVRRWVQGYRYMYKTAGGPRTGASPPIIHRDLPEIASRVAVSFTELIEILVVHALLERGVSMRAVRRAHRRAVRKLGVAHPFAWERLGTDGKGVFMELVQESEDCRPLLEMASGQYALPRVIDQYLHQIDFGQGSLMAVRWWPLGKAMPVVVDPSVAFGRPVIAGTRVPVQTVLNSLDAGESKSSVCRWLNLGAAQVAAAILLRERGKAA